MGPDREDTGPTDLATTLERLATRIGDDIGRRIVHALSAPAALGAEAKARPSCASDGCERFAVAKGLCKSHYNLMLYHRRKQSGRAPARRRGGQEE